MSFPFLPYGLEFQQKHNNKNTDWGEREKKGRRSNDSECPPDGSLCVSKLGHNFLTFFLNVVNEIESNSCPNLKTSVQKNP
jgi:hypothetical protein